MLCSFTRYISRRLMSYALFYTQSRMIQSDHAPSKIKKHFDPLSVDKLAVHDKSKTLTVVTRLALN